MVMDTMNKQLQVYFQRHGLNVKDYISTVTDGLRDNPFVVLIEEGTPKYLVINNTVCEYFDTFSEALEYLNTGSIPEKEEVSTAYTLKPYLENCDVRFTTPIKCLGLRDGVLIATLPVGLPTEEVVRAQRNIKAALQDATKRGVITDIQFLVLPEGANILKLERMV